jgi:hypothetical protein
MANHKILLLTHPYDQGDILEDYLEWHLGLGIDFIVAGDLGSSDNSNEILNSFSKRGQLEWFSLTEKSILNCTPGERLLKKALEGHSPDWILMSDVDEFLCPVSDNLKAILDRAAENDITAINVPCFNMTGSNSQPGRPATETRTLRIDQPVIETYEQQVSGDIPAPYIFIRHPPRTLIRTAALAEYGQGNHYATMAWGKTVQLPDLRILHYPIRGYDKFQAKIANTEAFFAGNDHLESWWGWHWRRWIRLQREGRLREDFENQFVSPERAEELIREGVCTRDETVASWAKRKRQAGEGVRDPLVQGPTGSD